MELNEILDFINNKFIIGTKKEYIHNIKLFVSYLINNNINELDNNSIDELINNYKMSNTIDTIIKLKNKVLFNNDIVFSLVLSYAEKNNIELNLDEEIDEDEVYLKRNITRTKRGRSTVIDDYLVQLPERQLTREEEIEYFKEIEKGREELKNEFAYYNLALVVSIAKRFNTKNNIPLEDLVQVGNLGLLKAIDKFEYRKGYRFSTYASWWIKQQITRYVYEQGRAIKIPVHQMEEITKIRKARKKLTNILNREPSIEEVAEYLNTTKDRICYYDSISQDITSLSVPINEDEDTTLGDMIPSDELNDSFIDGIFGEEVRKAAFEDNNRLTPRELEVIKLRYGFYNNREYKLEEIGKMYHVTRERIRQIEEKCKRIYKNNKKLKSLYEDIYGEIKKEEPKKEYEENIDEEFELTYVDNPSYYSFNKEIDLEAIEREKEFYRLRRLR